MKLLQLGILPPDQKPSSNHSTPLKRSGPPATALWNSAVSDPLALSSAVSGALGGSMDLSSSHTEDDPLFGGPAMFSATKRPGSSGSGAGSRPGSSSGGAGGNNNAGIAAVNISTISATNNTSTLHNTSRPNSASSKLNTTSYLGSHFAKASEIDVSDHTVYCTLESNCIIISYRLG